MNYTNSNLRRFGTLLGWDPARLLNDLMSYHPPGSEVLWTPFRSPVQVRQDQDGASITVDLPGVDEKDIDLELEAGMLTIAGKRGEHTYRFRVALGDQLDPESLEASLDKGVLTVTARTRPESRPRKIQLGGGPQQRTIEARGSERPGK